MQAAAAVEMIIVASKENLIVHLSNDQSLNQ